MRSMPYYFENFDFWYDDPRAGRIKLTDKANKKAIESYIEDISVSYPQLDWDKVCEVTAKDIEEYKQNKHRYTFESNDIGQKTLVAVDGKKIKENNYIEGILVNISDFK